MTDKDKETENTPTMEIHLGEITGALSNSRYRRCIIWINGKRWEGELYEQERGT